MLKKYLLNTSGNFGMMFAVSVSMLLLGVGAAIDISGSISQKTSLQAMSDAAVLAAVTSGETDRDQLKKIITESLAANNVDGLTLDWDFTVEGTSVNITLNSAYDTQLMGAFGKNELPLNVISEALIPEDVPINVALVLDRTGSMEGENMSALKAASAVLIDQFKNYDAETQVAVVPFSNYVNVGLSRRNETWIDVPPDETIFTPAGACYITDDRPCIQRQSETYERIVDGVRRTRTRNRCVARGNNGPKTVCPPAKTETITWNGCIGSRDNIHNLTAAYNNKHIPGILGVDCGEEVLPLTRNLNDVKNKINSLTASRETYLPVGLVNGWRMLEPNKPFDEISNADPTRRRTLILMTDGANTLSLEDPYINGKHCNEGSDQDDDICDGVVGVEGIEHTNTLTATLCENIKNDNIDIWSVAYNFDGTDTKAMLRACASGPSQYFDASNRAELIAAFENIGNTLFAVRLTR